jgi:phage tail sheath protein FI
MPEYLSPGVYIEEIDAGPKPIAPVATSTAGAVGATQRGPKTPILLTNYGDYVRAFGGPLNLPDDGTKAASAIGYYWQAAESVKGFFDEGGARLFFQRVTAHGASGSHADFKGGVYAGLARDVGPTDQTIALTHVFNLETGTKLGIVSGHGSPIGEVTVTGIDRATRVVTLGAPAGLHARAGQDLAVITAVDTNLDNVLRVTASSVGKWGDDLSVQILPSLGAQRSLSAKPGSGVVVTTQATAAAAATDTKIDVKAVPGSLDKATPSGFRITIDGGPPVSVTAVTDAAPDLTLGFASPLGAAVSAGAKITVVREAVAGAVLTVSGADRLYPGAVIQLEGATGSEIAEVTGLAGSQVTLSAPPAHAYVEGDRLSIVEADVRIAYTPAGAGAQTERFSGLRLTNLADPASLINGVNLRSRLVVLSAGLGYDATAITAFPAVTTGWAPLGGGDDALGSLTPADFIGDDPGPGLRTGIQALEDIGEVAICFVPGIWDADVRNALIVHCETLGDRFAVLDPPPNLDVQQVEAFRSPIDTKYAALYYPWLEILDPRPDGTRLEAPPSAFVAGVYARTDVTRGVHKAPANETLRSISGFTQPITKREQDILNPQNINVMRAFPGRGNRIWGARVLTSDAAWKYVPVRRLFLMLEKSIDEGTQWVVFEPNDEPLWARVRHSVENFLITQWQMGALQGVKAEQAFFVACDRSTMTQDDIDNGRLICQVGIAPVKPAEFVIFRVQQKTLAISTN